MDIRYLNMDLNTCIRLFLSNGNKQAIINPSDLPSVMLQEQQKPEEQKKLKFLRDLAIKSKV